MTYWSYSLPFPWNHCHSRLFPVQHLTTLHQQLDSLSFFIITNCHYVIVSQSMLQYTLLIHCSSVISCCYDKRRLFIHVQYVMTHSYFHVPCPIPISSQTVTPIPVGIPVPLHTSSLKTSVFSTASLQRLMDENGRRIDTIKPTVLSVKNHMPTVVIWQYSSIARIDLQASWSWPSHVYYNWEPFPTDVHHFTLLTLIHLQWEILESNQCDENILYPQYSYTSNLNEFCIEISRLPSYAVEEGMLERKGKVESEDK